LRAKLAFFALAVCVTVVIAAPVLAAATKVKRVSVSSSESQADNHSFRPAISANGRYVAFASNADNLVHHDTNGVEDVFVRDLKNGTTKLVSVSSSGAQGNNSSSHASISADGRLIAFDSYATNLTPGDTIFEDVFVHDMKTGKTKKVSASSSGVAGDNFSVDPSISANGRFVAFDSVATNLVAGDTNGSQDVFVRDLKQRKTRRASVSSSGAQGDDFSGTNSISADGRRVVFRSSATTLVHDDTNVAADIFVNDRKTHKTRRVDVSSAGAQANDDANGYPSISTNGRYVAFGSSASNLVAGDTNATGDIFLRDLDKRKTRRVSVSSSGTQANGGSFLVDPLVVSDDGRFIAFISLATNLTPGATTGEQVFLRDQKKDKTSLLNRSANGTVGNGASFDPSMTPDGRSISFASQATNLVGGDTNASNDIFVRTR
jgi:Tol biopolymer transport system component